MSARKSLITALLAGCLFAFVSLDEGSAQEGREGMRREQPGGRGRRQAMQWNERRPPRMREAAPVRRPDRGPGGRPGWKSGKGKFHSACPKILFALVAMIHVLLAVWGYQDLQKRKTGSGIWIVLLLLGGIPAAIAYAIVRIPEMRTQGQ